MVLLLGLWFPQCGAQLLHAHTVMSKRPSETAKSSKKLRNSTLTGEYKAEQQGNIRTTEMSRELFCKFVL